MNSDTDPENRSNLREVASGSEGDTADLETEGDRFIPDNDEDETLSDDFDWDMLAKKRKYKITSFVVCLLTTVGIVTYGVIENKETTCKKHNITINSNETMTVHKLEGKKTYPVLFNVGLGLLGVILGVFFDRVCLVFEELCLCQFKRRYDRECKKLISDSFSGISWKTVVLVAVMIIASCTLGRDTPLKTADYIYVLGGAGAGPLLIHLLNLHTESEITISRILEEKKLYPGYTLAWSYYFVTLKKQIKLFNDKILKSDPPIPVSLNRMILLLTRGTDIEDIDDLISYDEKIEKLNPNYDHKFPLYKLTLQSGETQIFVMICVRKPLVALSEMKETPKVPFVNAKSYKNEVKRFYKTLDEILEEAPDDICTKKCLVVPVTVKIGQYGDLKNGGMVKIIMKRVDKFRRASAIQKGTNKTTRNAFSLQHTPTEQTPEFQWNLI